MIICWVFSALWLHVFSQQEMLIPLVDRAVIQWHQYRAVSLGQVLLKVLCFQDAWKFNSMPSEPVLCGQTFKVSSQSVEWTSHFMKLKEPFLSPQSFSGFVRLLPVIIQQLRLLAFLSFLLFSNWLSICEQIGKRLICSSLRTNTPLNAFKYFAIFWQCETVSQVSSKQYPQSWHPEGNQRHRHNYPTGWNDFRTGNYWKWLDLLLRSSVVKEWVSFKCHVPLLRFPEVSIPGALILSHLH